MKVLLDTHIVCWHYYEPKRLPEKARQIILAAEAVFLSSASIWEIAMKARLGKINANPQRVFERIAASGFYELPVYARHAVKAADLPLYHADPFDRILIAQAISEPLHLLTADPQLKQYSDLVILV
jgi:PIN domain nuclease of toxin-antitoxin system